MVQCKNCQNGLRCTENKSIICIAWKNGGYVNGKKQRLCTRYAKRGGKYED